MAKTTKFNIAHIVLSLEVGGLEKVVLTLAAEQQKLNHQVIIICLDTIGTLGEEFSSQGVSILCLKRTQSRLDIKAILRLRSILKENKTNIIHTHNVEANIYGILSSFLIPGIKSIHTQHGIPDNFSKIKQVYLNITGRILGRFISVSDSAAQHAINNHWVHKNKTGVIINGIDTDEFTADPANRKNLRNEFNISESALVLTTVSRIEAVKDHATMIEQFSKAASENENIYLVIVGDGSLKNTIEKLIEKKNMYSRIILTGMQTDVKKYLQMADIFIMTSISEGISISLLEAMSTGLIPAVTPVGGNTQIITDKKSGFFIDITSPTSLSKILDTIKDDEEIRKSISYNARNEVIDHFSKDVMVNKYLQYYEKL